MKTQTIRLTALTVLASLTLTLPAAAGNKLGKPLKPVKVKTRTLDGDAQMNLPEYHGVKHALAVKEFERNVGVHDSNWQYLAKNLSLMFESALADTDHFVLVEREKLNHVMAEQDLVAYGRAQKSKVARTGKLRSAKYLATGEVTEIERDKSGTGGGISIKGVSVGARRNTAQITVIAKLIDTTTGEIVAKKRIVGRAGRAGLQVGASLHGVGGSADTFRQTPLGEATQDCMNQAARFFATTMETMPATGAVVLVKNEQVIINRGSVHNFQSGMELDVRTEGEELIDPETGAILDVTEGRRVARIRVNRVSEKVSYCEIVGGDVPQRGMTVVAR